MRQGKDRESRSRKTATRYWLPFLFVVMVLFSLAVVNAGERVIWARGNESTLRVVTDLPAGQEVGAINNFASREELLQELDGLVGGEDGKFGIYVVELDTGESYGIDEGQGFQAASTVKVPILADLYQEIEAGNVSREELMTYTSDDYEEGSGSIQYTDFGSVWTVAELAQKMMKESDNVAKNMLIRRLGIDQINAFIYEQGSAWDLVNNLTTPVSIANMLERMYENQITDQADTGEMFDLMTNTDFEDGLPRFLPGVRIAHKTGAWGNSVSDAGIVFLEGKPYIICVYSDDNPSPDDALATIGTISLDVYDYEAGR